MTIPFLALKHTLGPIGITQKNLAKFVHGKHILHSVTLPWNNRTIPFLVLKYLQGSIGITQKKLVKFVHGKSILHTVGQPGDNPINPFCGPREGHGSTGVTAKISANLVKKWPKSAHMSLVRKGWTVPLVKILSVLEVIITIYKLCKFYYNFPEWMNVFISHDPQLYCNFYWGMNEKRVIKTDGCLLFRKKPQSHNLYFFYRGCAFCRFCKINNTTCILQIETSNIFIQFPSNFSFQSKCFLSNSRLTLSTITITWRSKLCLHSNIFLTWQISTRGPHLVTCSKPTKTVTSMSIL